jgi:hypothetical protein
MTQRNYSTPFRLKAGAKVKGCYTGTIYEADKIEPAMLSADLLGAESGNGFYFLYDEAPFFVRREFVTYANS